jgi:hypothetical protein
MASAKVTVALAVFASLGAGCAVPHFDVPADSAGQPTVETIVNRIECEMKDMVRDDKGDDYVPAFHRLFLLDRDYGVEVTLSIEVNDTGGLAPSLTWMEALNKVSSVALNATATLSESRDHNFTENIQLSFRNIYTQWKNDNSLYTCPPANTALAGTLGLKDFVAMADLTPGLDTKQTLSGKGVFGGSVQFLVTKNLSALGPTWSLVHFKGPGSTSLSELNTDKATFAFAQGPNAGTKMNPFVKTKPNPPNVNTHFFLQQLLTSSINSQLITLQNSLPQ